MSLDKKELQKKRYFSEFFYNKITYTGIYFAVLIFIVECILFGIDFFTVGLNTYLGIITYLILPAFLLMALALIPLGALRKRRWIKKNIASAEPRPYKIDLSFSTHRNAILVFLIGTMILIIMTGVGSYKAFQYTESTKFCGMVCHKVMRPEYVAHSQSPHARVKCVDCHIGSGVSSYMHSKLSGLRQIYKVVTNTYTKPIQTPIQDLRPAREICEECHWPQKNFFRFREVRRTYFPTESDDYSPWYLRMLVHTVQNESENYGIHSHMNPDNDVYYAADDKSRQKISWVKSVDKNGIERIYISPDSKYKQTPPAPDEIRKMDCIDCHNRPAHHFPAPFILVNKAMLDGRIDANIPLIKEKSVEVLSEKYTSQTEASAAINEELGTYYKNSYKDFYKKNKNKVEQSIKNIISLYQNNFFPEMNARWDAYPINIGHLTSPGCFRCHDNKHESSEGKVIPQDCTICHTIIEQGPINNLEKNDKGLQFRHPFDEDDTWKEMNCYECHMDN